MELQRKQVTVTPALENTSLCIGCPLKQAAGYKVGKVEQLGNSLQSNLTN